MSPSTYSAMRRQYSTSSGVERRSEKCEDEEVGLPRIARRIELAGPLSDEQRDRLHQIADRCPVKQTLQRGLVVETVTGMPEGPPSVG